MEWAPVATSSCEGLFPSRHMQSDAGCTARNVASQVAHLKINRAQTKEDSHRAKRSGMHCEQQPSLSAKDERARQKHVEDKCSRHDPTMGRTSTMVNAQWFQEQAWGPAVRCRTAGAVWTRRKQNAKQEDPQVSSNCSQRGHVCGTRTASGCKCIRPCASRR